LIAIFLSFRLRVPRAAAFRRARRTDSQEHQLVTSYLVPGIVDQRVLRGRSAAEPDVIDPSAHLAPHVAVIISGRIVPPPAHPVGERANEAVP
jgi:hypothetical protein